ncbi:unnamed protein product [marine sediment metagenome]|uniref:Uncharacterized protein n=1 Tax=marine sediment metagenome TaxID=412755 RepID=X1NUY9_9ZZZZ
MYMVGRIIYRILKSSLRVLLIGWTPGPPPDFADRLHAVELKAEATRQKVYRDGKAEEAAADAAVIADVPVLPAVLAGTPGFHPSGQPIQNGDPVQ